jgi:DNA-binding CsgD family transcriptional regulator
MSKRGKRVLTPRERELARRVAVAKKARRRYALRLKVSRPTSAC